MKRSGVTLVEVLFGIAIAAVGILGVLATLVVAGRQAANGAALDGADRLGRNAIREVAVRGFNRAAGPRGTWSTVPIGGHAYCLDPLYVASNGTASPHNWFPAFDPATIPGARMHRVSVRSFPGGAMVPAGQMLADSIFRANDDLVFSLPGDRTLAPQQVPAGFESRASEGAFSWFATFQGANYRGENAIMHVVVCHRRDVADPGAERLLAVERIDEENPALPLPADRSNRGRTWKLAVRAGRTSGDLDVRERSWVLVTGASSGMYWFRWHLVVSIGDVLPAGTPDIYGDVSAVDTRFISTQGPAWPLGPSETQIAVIDRVVAVYEKTIKMEE
jgi:hypothetical protein